MPSTRVCGRADAAERFRKAKAFLDVACLALDAERFDPAASDAVLAGIAASDALCCLVLHKRAAGDDHSAAVALLSSIDPTSAAALRRLLSIKYKAQYDARPVTATEAAEAIKRASRLVDRAGGALARG